MHEETSKGTKYRHKALNRRVYKFQTKDQDKRIKLKNKTEDFQRERTVDGNPLGKRKITFRWQEVIERFGWETNCYLTGEPIKLDEPVTYHFDHIIPCALGGESTLDNLGIATKNANLAKSDMTVEQFLALCEKVLKHHGYEVRKTAL